MNRIGSHGSDGRKPRIAPSSSSSSSSAAAAAGRASCRRDRSAVVAHSYSARRPSERSFGRDRRPSYSPDVSELDIQEQIAQLDLEPHKLLSKGEANTMQAIIKDVMPVGYFVSLPTGRDGYLPADDLGFTGGLAVLQRLFKEGQEITVRIVCRGGAGREIVSIKKPEFAPPSEQKTIESLRLHFENEKKNRMNPRNRRHQSYNNNNNYNNNSY
jgi:predicted RNA-binding protein with RPS1 domain